MALKKTSKLLGIAFEGRGMTAAVLKPNGSGVVVQQAFQKRLTLDPLSSDPELAGREIRNHLDSAGVRVSRCVVCVPLNWALTLRTELPPLEGDDLDSFITLQAEREFPFAPGELAVSVSRYQARGGPEQATVVALPSNRVRTVQKVLKAANLKPDSITLGISSLPAPESTLASAVILVGGNGVDLAIAVDDGIAALRALEGPAAPGQEETGYDAEGIARELRITIGRLPASIRDTLKTVRVYGGDPESHEFLDELTAAMAPMGLAVMECEPFESLNVRGHEKCPHCSPTVVSAVTGRLSGSAPVFEFLPPYTSPVRRFINRISARGPRSLGVAAALLAVIVGGAFWWQGWRLGRLESRWETMGPKAAAIEEIQEKIRQYRDWFDEDAPSLRIALSLTGAFPEEGAVWARSVGIEDLSEVTCTGSARSSAAWLGMLEGIRETPGVTGLQVLQVRGGEPVQFSLSYQWKAGQQR